MAQTPSLVDPAERTRLPHMIVPPLIARPAERMREAEESVMYVWPYRYQVPLMGKV